MMNDEGLVVGIEHIPQLYKFGLENISKSHYELIKNKNIILVEGDGRKGYAAEAPYDCIHVGAGKINQINCSGTKITKRTN
jgi:protein-L-isoaspartate(D-aspartate) O-methyltransferase